MIDLLELNDLKVWFGGIKAVDGVSLTVRRGSIYSLVGPNGSGKTTLINAISRVTHVTDGAIRFDGHDITNAKSFKVGRLGLARTFQGIRLVQTLTVLENVMLGVDYRLWRRDGSRRPAWSRSAQKEIEERAYAALERVGIGAFAKRFPGELSYGSQRRVEIGRGMAGDPALLLLDEPVAGMNQAERAEIADLLLGIKEDGVTQLLVEHDLRMVIDLSDHLFVANFGKLIAEGEPEATAALPQVVEAYLGRRGVS